MARRCCCCCIYDAGHAVHVGGSRYVTEGFSRSERNAASSSQAFSPSILSFEALHRASFRKRLSYPLLFQAWLVFLSCPSDIRPDFIRLPLRNIIAAQSYEKGNFVVVLVSIFPTGRRDQTSTILRPATLLSDSGSISCLMRSPETLSNTREHVFCLCLQTRRLLVWFGG